MSDAYVYVNGNKAEISLPAGARITVKAKTNSSLVQKVSVTSKDRAVDYQFTGTGERNTVSGQETFTGPSQLSATFEYSDSAGVFKPSKLNSGGPYDIGSYHLMVIVAENGDDSDYNDAILEFSWHTPR
ncbi:fucose-binding lectin II [Kitasatospora acidiphila]|uniref:fucose-binding lectin II n=1 Tax=Kitasatospora acidiphila TaxID=2567942 RepID=UPI0015F07373|nr:fucose-binding lectin II [Kitasatospora acidiphila]